MQGDSGYEQEYEPRYEFELEDEDERSDRSFVVALLLCLFLGVLGVHRFYVGKIGTGLLLLLTGGGFGIWWIVDFVRIAASRFQDREGFYLEP